MMSEGESSSKTVVLVYPEYMHGWPITMLFAADARCNFAILL